MQGLCTFAFTILFSIPDLHCDCHLIHFFNHTHGQINHSVGQGTKQKFFTHTTILRLSGLCPGQTSRLRDQQKSSTSFDGIRGLAILAEAQNSDKTWAPICCKSAEGSNKDASRDRRVLVIAAEAARYKVTRSELPAFVRRQCIIEQ